MCDAASSALASSIAREGELNGVEQILFAKRLGQELDCAGLHGLYAHRYVSVSGDENDREVDACLGQVGLEFQPAHSG